MPEKIIDPDRLIGDWIDEKCPRCAAQLLGNLEGDKWCSYVKCDYGCENAYAKLGLNTREGH